MLAITDFNGTYVKEGDTVACIMDGELVKGTVEKVCQKSVLVRYAYRPGTCTYTAYRSCRRFVKMEE